jgi:cytochrome c
VWEAKCAGCHGIFGESNEVFSPIVGGTTREDVKTGRVARLRDPAYPQRTTLMKLSQLSTLWDYINRAMPWTAPKSLTTDEVYAVTAYILHLGEILPADFTLSDRNMREVQALLPNRNGVTTAHAKWPGPEFGARRKPDVQGDACMRDCAAEPSIASYLPDHARNAHGNLAQQQRLVGPQRGSDTAPKAAPPSAQQAAAAATCCRRTSASPATRSRASWWGRPSATLRRAMRGGPTSRTTWSGASARAASAPGARSRCRRNRSTRPMRRPSPPGWRQGQDPRPATEPRLGQYRPGPPRRPSA